MIYDTRFLVWLLPLFSITAIGLSSGTTEPSYETLAECTVWTLVMELLKLKDEFIISCQHNEKCTGFMCNGTAMFDVNNKYGIQFGADFLPCNKPQQLRITSETLSGATSEFLNITATSIVTDIPVATVSGLGSVKIVLTVGLQSFNVSHVGLEINATVERDQLPRTSTLLPRLYIMVPPCVVSRVVSHDDTLTDISCKEGTLHQCGNNQECRRDGLNNESHCECVHNLVWDKATQMCITSLAPTNDAASSNVVVIVVCSLLGLVVIAVVLAIIVKYRRYRQRYGQHELLINNEGSDRDLDGDSPMLDG